MSSLPRLLILCLAILAACQAPVAQPPLPTPPPPLDPALLALFDYDPAAPLDLVERSATPQDGYTLIDLNYASPHGGRVSAFLAVPDGPGPFAGLLLQHGLPGSREENVDLARGLAAAGAVVLMIDAPFARHANLARSAWPLTWTETDRREQIQLIVDLRRGVDLLLARPDVDTARLAYVGYSYGAMMGGLLAGVEHRLQAYALLAGNGGLVTHNLRGAEPLAGLGRLPAVRREQWLALMEPIEPIHFVGHAAPAALYFQNGRLDEQIDLEDAEAYHAAGSEPKRIDWYDAGHLLSPEAFADMAAWLETQVGLNAAQFTPPPWWQRTAGAGAVQ